MNMSCYKLLTNQLWVDDALGAEEEPPDIESWFPSNSLDTGSEPQFCTTSDDDFGTKKEKERVRRR